MLESNPHFHALVLEGGFDEERTLHYIPFSSLEPMVELLRGRTPEEHAASSRYPGKRIDDAVWSFISKGDSAGVRTASI